MDLEGHYASEMRLIRKTLYDITYKKESKIQQSNEYKKMKQSPRYDTTGYEWERKGRVV